MRFWERFWTKIRFLWHSTNAHGVHSPFVYDWLTIGMKKQPSEPKFDKHLRVLYRNVRYFNPTKIGVLGSKPFRLRLPLDSTKMKVYDFSEREIFDLIIVENIANHSEFEVLLTVMHEHSVLLIQEIASNVVNDCMADERIHVSIDCMYWKLFFKRPHQVKEHFILRIN